MRTNSWSKESKPENTSPREQFPADGTSRESQAFRGLPFPQPVSPHYSGYPAARAQSGNPRSRSPGPSVATHPLSRFPSAR